MFNFLQLLQMLAGQQGQQGQQPQMPPQMQQPQMPMQQPQQGSAGLFDTYMQSLFTPRHRPPPTPGYPGGIQPVGGGVFGFQPTMTNPGARQPAPTQAQPRPRPTAPPRPQQSMFLDPVNGFQDWGA